MQLRGRLLGNAADSSFSPGQAERAKVRTARPPERLFCKGLMAPFTPSSPAFELNVSSTEKDINDVTDLDVVPAIAAE